MTRKLIIKRIILMIMAVLLVGAALFISLLTKNGGMMETVNKAYAASSQVMLCEARIKQSIDKPFLGAYARYWVINNIECEYVDYSTKTYRESGDDYIDYIFLINVPAAALEGGTYNIKFISVSHSFDCDGVTNHPGMWCSETVFENYQGSGTSTKVVIQLTVISEAPTEVGLPPDPVKAGYDFVGWYYDETFVLPYDGAPVYANTNLYAKFTPTIYTITYNANGGNLSGQTTNYTIESAAITFPTPTPTKSGYAFGGWYENADFTGNAITGIPKGSMGNKSVYAKWPAIVYTITYETNGGTLVTDIASYTVESETITLPIPTREGYEFKGWYRNPSLGGTARPTIPKGSIGEYICYAKWEILKYSVVFYVDGVVYSALIVEHGTTLKDLGLQADGWYYDAAFTRPVSANDILSGDTFIYAKMSAVPAPQMVLCEAVITQSADRPFLGGNADYWVINNLECEFLEYSTNTYIKDGDDYTDYIFLINVPAQALLSGTYNIRFINSGHGFDCDGVTNHPGIFCYEYVFDNYLVKNVAIKFTILGEIPDIEPDPDPTEQFFDVGFRNLLFGEVPNPVYNVPYGTLISTFPNISDWVSPRGESFKFVGWKQDNGEYIITCNTVLTAVFEQLSFIVTILSPQSTQYLPITVNATINDINISLLTISELTNPLLTFAGWYYDSAYTEPVLSTDKIADKTLYMKFEFAVFEISVYIVKREFGIDSIDKMTYIFHKSYIFGYEDTFHFTPPIIDDYTWFEGFTFLGFFEEKDLEKPYITGVTKVIKSVNLYAMYELAPDFYLYLYDGTMLLNKIKLSPFQGYALPTDLTKEGYVFKGWQFESGTKCAAFINPTEELSVYAIWEDEEGPKQDISDGLWNSFKGGLREIGGAVGGFFGSLFGGAAGGFFSSLLDNLWWFILIIIALLAAPIWLPLLLKLLFKLIMLPFTIIKKITKG